MDNKKIVTIQEVELDELNIIEENNTPFIVGGGCGIICGGALCGGTCGGAACGGW